MRILLVFLLSFSFILSGCSTIAGIGGKILDGDLKVKIAIDYSVTKLIVNGSSPSATATKLIDIASGMKSFWGGGEDVLLNSALDELRKRIPWRELDAADTMLAVTLIEVLKEELQNRISNGIIDQNSVMKVDALANLIIDSAKRMK